MASKELYTVHVLPGFLQFAAHWPLWILIPDGPSGTIVLTCFWAQLRRSLSDPQLYFSSTCSVLRSCLSLLISDINSGPFPGFLPVHCSSHEDRGPNAKHGDNNDLQTPAKMQLGRNKWSWCPSLIKRFFLALIEETYSKFFLYARHHQRHWGIL